MEVPAGAAPLKSQPHSPPLFPQQIPIENLLCSDTRYSATQMPGRQKPTKPSLSLGELMS